jgi:hypothetical protein
MRFLGQRTRAAPGPAQAEAVFVDGVRFIVVVTRMWDVVIGIKPARIEGGSDPWIGQGQDRKPEHRLEEGNIERH